MDDDLQAQDSLSVESPESDAASDSSADLIEVDLPDDESPDDPDAPDDDDADDDDEESSAAPTPDELALLRARAQELEAQNQQYVARLREQQQRERQQQDQALRARVKSDYQQAKARITREAEDQLNPAAFVAANMERLNDWYAEQLLSFEQQEKQLLRDAWARAERPNYAAMVAQEYNLTPDELADLREYEPSQMVNEAKRMLARRKETASLRKELDQLKREIAAGRAAPAAVTPGAGRGRSRRVKAGSQEHLAALLMGG